MCSAVPVPKIRDDAYGEIRSKKQIEDARIDPCGNTNISIAHIVLQGGPTHGTLCFRAQASQQQENDSYQPFHA